MLATFLQRLLGLVDALMSHPRVRVTHLWIGRPATDAGLAELAEAWGAPLPAALVELYRQADGIQLRWLDIGDEMYDPARDDKLRMDGPWSRLCDQRAVVTGQLDLPTLAELRTRDTVGAMFDHEDADDPHLHRAVPFDSISESQDAVLFYGDGIDDPSISVSSDYLADVDPPGATTLSSYLDHVLATWASLDHRRHAGPCSLGSLLRERAALDPTRLVGHRVLYVDKERGNSLMHGRVLALATLPEAPREWWYGPMLAQLLDDLGEQVHVPFAALYPTDDVDDYERLHADPAALQALLRGPAPPMFVALASVSISNHGIGLRGGGPCVSNHAWAYAALTSVLPPAEAVGALLCAARTLYEHPEVNTERTIAWPRTRPPNHPYGAPQTAYFGTLAAGLRDAAVLHIGIAAPAQLERWLGREAAANVVWLLQHSKASNRLNGYDPLTDLSRPAGYLYNALRGGLTALDTTPLATHKGGPFGLPDLRIVGP